jgi:hypothetical protein
MKLYFSGQKVWLERHAKAEADRFFDEHGWRKDWVSTSFLAEKMWPHLGHMARNNYMRALLAYLVDEGRQTGNPQVLVRHGQVSFEVAQGTLR